MNSRDGQVDALFVGVAQGPEAVVLHSKSQSGSENGSGRRKRTGHIAGRGLTVFQLVFAACDDDSFNSGRKAFTYGNPRWPYTHRENRSWPKSPSHIFPTNFPTKLNHLGKHCRN